MNNRSSIDLLALVGAKLMSVEINGKKVNVVAIPTGWNDISVTADKTTNEPNHAYLNMREWETSQKFREACVLRHQDEEDYIAPSHQISVSYSEDFTKAAIASAEKRLRADKEFMARGLSDEDIKNEARYAVNNKARIGYVTPLKRAEPAAYTGTAPTAQGVGSWTPPAEVSPEDDLPF